MLLGDFASAWRESDDIDARSRPDSNRFWDGKSLRGKHVIVRCLHGLGDTIQYIRYVPQLRRQVATLTIETQPALKLLIQESGLLERRLYSERPPREEYILTERGRDFRPVLWSLLAWGNRHFAPEGAEKYPKLQVAGVFKELEGKIVRWNILDNGTRIDGRDVKTVRPIVCEVGVLPRTHGSALFTRWFAQNRAR